MHSGFRVGDIKQLETAPTLAKSLFSDWIRAAKAANAKAANAKAANAKAVPAKAGNGKAGFGLFVCFLTMLIFGQNWYILVL